MNISYPVVPVAGPTFLPIINCLAVRNVISFPTSDDPNVTADMTSIRLQLCHSQNTHAIT